MKNVNWTAVSVFSVIGLLVLAFGVSLLGGRAYGGWGYGGWGMMGPWMMGPLMMFGMFFMWLIPIGFLVLTGLGIAWIVRTAGSTTHPNAAGHTCPSCGRSVQADWKNCPHCGAVLPK